MMSPTGRIHRLLCKIIEDRIFDCIPNGWECWSEQIRIDLSKMTDSPSMKFAEPDIFVGTDLIWKGEVLISNPSFIVEVLSRSTMSTDLNEKVDLYKSIGVSEYLIVNPRGVMTLHDFKSDKVYSFSYGDSFIVNSVPNLSFNCEEIFNKVDSILERFGYDLF